MTKLAVIAIVVLLACTSIVLVRGMEYENEPAKIRIGKDDVDTGVVTGNESTGLYFRTSMLDKWDNCIDEGKLLEPEKYKVVLENVMNVKFNPTGKTMISGDPRNLFIFLEPRDEPLQYRGEHVTLKLNNISRTGPIFGNDDEAYIVGQDYFFSSFLDGKTIKDDIVVVLDDFVNNQTKLFKPTGKITSGGQSYVKIWVKRVPE